MNKPVCLQPDACKATKSPLCRSCFENGGIWTPERVTQVKTLWLEGHSATHIASMVSTASKPITRNAIIGRIHRMGLNRERISHPSRPRALAGQPKPTKPRRVVPHSDKPKLRLAKVNPMPVIAPPSTGKKTLIELAANDCRYICDDDLFCAEPKDNGSSYCPGHRARCCYPMPPRKQSNADRNTRFLARTY